MPGRRKIKRKPLSELYVEKNGKRGPRTRARRVVFSECVVRVIPRTALSPGTKMVRGRFVDDMKNGRVKSRFVAAEVARDVRHDVHAGTPALKALRMIVSFAATRDGKHRPRSVAFYDIVAAFVHARLWGLFPKAACWRMESASCCGRRSMALEWLRNGGSGTT